ncbi:hypothetical protein LG634_11715 [Streptomyces bambusae]|uniref:hypothetical protein n=1 Tax=Streptomyces bambusae TaxID=1550616 RepID=UPI001CFE0DF9|nr:hypothetical protein [Streptomyces bambusae]MCB5165496.1 hypothetical protein [Streptomyces bambusae]
MSQESVPEHTGQAAHDHVRPEHTVPAQSAPQKGLLQQMEELMAALNADLSQLDADLQSSAERPAAAPVPHHGAGQPAPEAAPERPSYRAF